MHLTLMMSAVGIVIVTGGGMIFATSALAADTYIFSSQQPVVDRGAIILDENSCVRQQCFAADLAPAWNNDRNNQNHLFDAQSKASATTAASMRADPANILNSRGGEGAVLATRQTGADNRITSVQDPAAMAVSAVLTQAGYDNEISGLQQGNHNVAMITQSGAQNVSSFSQTGFGNVLTIRQH